MKAAGGEDLQVEHPIGCGDSPAFHFHSTLAGMYRSTLIRHQVIQMCEPREKRLLASLGMMEPLHSKQLSLDGVMGLIQQGTGRGHLRVSKDHIPARLFRLKPAPDALPVGLPCGVGDVGHKVTQSLPQRHHAQALALSCPIEQGVEFRPERLTHGRRNRRQFLRELEERVAHTAAKTCPRQQGAQTLGGTVKAIGEDPADPIRRLLLGCRVLKRPLRLGERCRTGLLRIAEMPGHSGAAQPPAADCLQPLRVPRCGFRQRLRRGVRLPSKEQDRREADGRRRLCGGAL
jgi:hypothetical protein